MRRTESISLYLDFRFQLIHATSFLVLMSPRSPFHFHLLLAHLGVSVLEKVASNHEGSLDFSKELGSTVVESSNPANSRDAGLLDAERVPTLVEGAFSCRPEAVASSLTRHTTKVNRNKLAEM